MQKPKLSDSINVPMAVFGAVVITILLPPLAIIAWPVAIILFIIKILDL